MNNSKSLLFRRFEDDIIFDAHSLRARIGRSFSARKIINSDDPDILTDLVAYLKNYKPPTQIEGLAADCRYAWGVVLCGLFKKHNIDRCATSIPDLDRWVKILTEHVYQ